ncbi:exosome complex protein Rrp42 [Nanoarchaeota archaeon]
MYGELKNEIISLLGKGTRLDGRKPLEHRDVQVEVGVVKNADGSARVKIGETEVLAGITMEIMKPYSDSPDVGSLMVNVELYPMSNPEFESGPPSITAIELARVTDRCIRESKMLDVKKLCVTAGEKIWMVVIDVCTINVDGNLFDAVPLAALAALKNCVFPGYDGENVDYKNRTDKKLPLSRNPVSVTVYKYDDKLLLDPTTDEERVYDTRLTVGVLEDGNLCSMQKGGDHAISMDTLFEMIDIAVKKAEELRKKMG